MCAPLSWLTHKQAGSHWEGCLSRPVRLRGCGEVLTSEADDPGLQGPGKVPSNFLFFYSLKRNCEYAKMFWDSFSCIVLPFRKTGYRFSKSPFLPFERMLTLQVILNIIRCLTVFDLGFFSYQTRRTNSHLQPCHKGDIWYVWSCSMKYRLYVHLSGGVIINTIAIVRKLRPLIYRWANMVYVNYKIYPRSSLV